MGLLGRLETALRSCNLSRSLLVATAASSIVFTEPCVLRAQEQQTSQLFPGLRNPDQVKTRKYRIGSEYEVTLTEIKDTSSRLNVYEISINVLSSAQTGFEHIKQVGIIASGEGVLEDRVQMFCNTSKSDRWFKLVTPNKEDHALIFAAYDLYKDFVPAVANVEDYMEKLRSFFNWLDEKRESSVYPRFVTQGNHIVIPTDIVQDNWDFGFAKGQDYIDGIRIVVGSLQPSDFFIKFAVGHNTSIPTASKEFGVEIGPDRNDPSVYAQTRGNVSLDAGRDITERSKLEYAVNLLKDPNYREMSQFPGVYIKTGQKKDGIIYKVSVTRSTPQGKKQTIQAMSGEVICDYENGDLVLRLKDVRAEPMSDDNPSYGFFSFMSLTLDYKNMDMVPAKRYSPPNANRGVGAPARAALGFASFDNSNEVGYRKAKETAEKYLIGSFRENMLASMEEEKDDHKDDKRPAGIELKIIDERIGARHNLEKLEPSLRSKDPSDYARVSLIGFDGSDWITDFDLIKIGGEWKIYYGDTRPNNTNQK